MPFPRPASLKVRALQWLAQREHSRAELRTKLLWLLQRSTRDAHVEDGGIDCADDTVDIGCAGEPALEVDALLDWLQQHGHLSDARFIESRVHARQSRFGHRRIQQELRQHGVALDAAAQQALQQSELARATEVWQRKYGVPAGDAAARVRQMRFMLGRGFSMDVVRHLVQGGSGAAGGTGGDV
ncbi:MAG: regulatory protein RecX [Aquabacterium sp.]|nr:regulatory protein RecX [Aquabacterium sp.]